MNLWFFDGYTKQSKTGTIAEYSWLPQCRILTGFVTNGDSSEENGDLL